jgi:hypothetical protein
MTFTRPSTGNVAVIGADGEHMGGTVSVVSCGDLDLVESVRLPASGGATYVFGRNPLQKPKLITSCSTAFASSSWLADGGRLQQH